MLVSEYKPVAEVVRRHIQNKASQGDLGCILLCTLEIRTLVGIYFVQGTIPINVGDMSGHMRMTSNSSFMHSKGG